MEQWWRCTPRMRAGPEGVEDRRGCRERGGINYDVQHQKNVGNCMSSPVLDDLVHQNFLL